LSDDVTSHVKEGTDEVTKLFKNLNDDLVGGSLVPAMFKSITDVFKTGFDDLVAKTSNFINTIIGFFQTMAETLVGRSIITDMMESMMSIITGGLAEILTAIVSFVADVIAKITAMAEDVLSEFTSLKDDAIAAVETMATNIIGQFTAIKDDAIEAISAMITDVIDDVTTFAADFVDALSEIPGNVIALFSDMGGDILDEFGAQGILDSLTGVGESWINAIREGIEAKWQELLDWVGSLLDQIPDLNPFDGAGGEVPMGGEGAMFGGGMSRTTINNFNLVVNSRAETSPVVQSFQEMQALVVPA